MTYKDLLCVLKKAYKEQLRELDMFIELNPWIINCSEEMKTLIWITCYGTMHKATYPCQLYLKKGYGDTVCNIYVRVGSLDICVGGFRNPKCNSWNCKLYLTDIEKYGDKTIEEAALLLYQDWAKRMTDVIKEVEKERDAEHERIKRTIHETHDSIIKQINNEFMRVKAKMS